MQKVSLAQVLNVVDTAIEAEQLAREYHTQIQEAKSQIEVANLLLLASIAQTLDNLVKNGIMVERP